MKINTANWIPGEKGGSHSAPPWVRGLEGVGRCPPGVLPSFERTRSQEGCHHRRARMVAAVKSRFKRLINLK